MTGDAIVVRPTNNIYTVLIIVSTLLNIAAFVVLYLRANNLEMKLF
jgi:NADH:ubiquinone oxidoreductase subunit 6 (subunit J)